MDNKKQIFKACSEVTMKGNTAFLVKDIAKLIDEARYHVARDYNSTQALLCWLIGKRINEEILKTERAEYGEEIVMMWL